MQVSKNQVQEWTENPVTGALLEVVKKEIQRIGNTPVTDCLFPGEPDKTHENLVNLEAREMVWGIVEDVLQGDWEYFVEEDLEQHVRDIPERE